MLDIYLPLMQCNCRYSEHCPHRLLHLQSDYSLRHKPQTQQSPARPGIRYGPSIKCSNSKKGEYKPHLPSVNPSHKPLAQPLAFYATHAPEHFFPFVSQTTRRETEEKCIKCKPFS